MRRIIAVLIVLFILGGLVAGGVYYHLKNTGKRLRWQVQMALQGSNKQAIPLAERYLEQNPNDPQAWMLAGRSYLKFGRYDDARKLFQRVIDDPGVEAPRRQQATIYLAETWANPAREVVQDPADLANLVDGLKQAVESLTKANEILAKASPGDAEQKLEIERSIAYNLLNLRNAHWRLADWYRRQAEVQANAGKVKEAETFRAMMTRELAARDEFEKQARDRFLACVEKDAARSDTAMTLLGLAMRSGDPKLIERVETLVFDQETPPAMPALELIIYDINVSLSKTTPDKREEVLRRGVGRLDKLLEVHPDNVNLLVRRGEIALTLGDVNDAEEFADKALLANPEYPEAVFLKARLHMVQNRPGEAVELLRPLVVKNPERAGYRFEYARALLATGQAKTARAQIGHILDGPDPNHRQALEYMTRYLISVGEHTEAVRHAERLHDNYPGDPVAIKLYAEALVKDRRIEDAVKVLEVAAARMPTDTGVLAAVAEMYRAIGKSDKFEEYARRVARSEATTKEDKLARARVLLLSGRGGAEKILLDLEKAYPQDPRVHFELGRLLDATRRKMQAIEQYRKAVQLNPTNANYRMVLAQALYDIDDIDACREVLAGVDDELVAKKMLLMQIDMGRGGKPEDIEQLKLKGSSRLALALAYLRNGDVDQCISICKQELEGPAPDPEVRKLMGMAYAAKGDAEKALENLEAALPRESWSQGLYRRIAAVLVELKQPRYSPVEVRNYMMKLEGAQQGMVDMTVGWLYERQAAAARDNEQRTEAFSNAAQSYINVVQWGMATAELKDRARLMAANAYAAAGKTDQALAQLDILAGKDMWKTRALFYKAQVLARPDKPGEKLDDKKTAAVARELDRLLKLIKDDSEMDLLHRTAQAFFAIGKPERGWSVIERIKKLRPGDPASWLIEARYARLENKTDQAVAAYRKAIELQPGNFQTYVMLADLYVNQDRHPEALRVLEAMAEISEAGRTESLFKRGQLYQQLGLTEQAVDCYQELSKLGFADTPQLKFTLGQVLAFLDQKEQARRVMSEIPRSSKLYLQSRQYMVEMAVTNEGKIAEINKLLEEFPTHAGLVAQKMGLLAASGKYRDALDTLKQFRQAHPKLRLPATFHEMAFQIMVRQGDEAAAAAMTSEVAVNVNSPLWRRRAVLLNPTIKGLVQEQAKLLVEPDMVDALVFLAAFSKLGDAERVDYYHKQLLSIHGSMQDRDARMGVPGRLLMLADLAAGVEPQKTLVRVDNESAVVKQDARQLVELGSGGRTVAELAAEMIRCTMAGHNQLAMAAFGRQWAIGLLKQHPGCDWMTRLALQGGNDPESLQQVLDLMKDKDTLLGLEVRAALALGREKYEEAARLFGRLADASPGADIEMLLQQATCYEQADKRLDALNVYNRLLDKGRDTLGEARYLMAANNAAYLTSILFPDNAGRLKDARDWIETAVKGRENRLPGEFLDTRGWIYYLMGERKQALDYLRAAVKRRSDSFDLQFHLGVVEKEVGDKTLALWHLQAAKNLGTQKLKNENVAADVLPRLEQIRKDIQELEDKR